MEWNIVEAFVLTGQTSKGKREDCKLQDPSDVAPLGLLPRTSFWTKAGILESRCNKMQQKSPACINAPILISGIRIHAKNSWG